MARRAWPRSRPCYLLYWRPALPRACDAREPEPLTCTVPKSDFDQLALLGPELLPTTPVRRQYLELKARHPDAILFFRLGDFYETFDDDARTVSRALDIVLTGRDMGRGER